MKLHQEKLCPGLGQSYGRGTLKILFMHKTQSIWQISSWFDE
jgi:hypothetical protein